MVRRARASAESHGGRKKSGVSDARRYKEMGEFWDTHDATDYMDESKEVQMNVRIESEVTYCALDNTLCERLQRAAVKHGVSSDTLVNMWVQDKLEAEQVR
jgi:hypothetical protein